MTDQIKVIYRAMLCNTGPFQSILHNQFPATSSTRINQVMVISSGQVTRVSTSDNISKSDSSKRYTLKYQIFFSSVCMQVIHSLYPRGHICQICFA